MRHAAMGLLALAALDLGRPEGLMAACAGDCDGDGSVAINELVRAVGIALGGTPLGQCATADANGDGNVTIAELVGAVGVALGGCNGAPTRTPTPTSLPNGTPTVVVPGCSNGTFDVSYSNATAGNFVTDPLTLDLVAAATVRDPRSGAHIWGITGLQCTGNAPRFERAVQLQIIGPRTGFTPGTYAITPPLGTFIYQETPDSSAQGIRAWDTAGGTLTIEEVNGSQLRFRISAPMKPQPLISFGNTPEGTFTLEVEGTVENFTAQ